MGRRVWLVVAALAIGFVLAVVFFPSLRAQLRRPEINRAGAGPADPVLIGATGYLSYVRDGDVYVIDVAQGSTLRSTKTGGASHPRTAPGGQFVAFERAGRLFVAKADGSAEFIMREGDLPSSARWASYNSTLVFSSRAGAMMTFDPRVGDLGHRILDVAESGVGPNFSWASSGTKIAFERRRPVQSGITRDGIWVVDTVASKPVATPVYFTTGTSGLRLCCWTGNDQFILFWQVPLGTDGPGAPARLLLASATSSEPIEVSAASLMIPGLIGRGGLGQLTPLVDGGLTPWPARKSLVVFEPIFTPAGTLGTRRVVIEGSENVSPGLPSVTVNNSQVAYSLGASLQAAKGDVSRSLASRRIWTVGIDGKQKRSLLAEATVPQSVSDDRPIWSRDSKTIMFMRRLSPLAAEGAPNRAGQLEVWVAYADGSNARRVIGNLEDPGISGIGTVAYEKVVDFHP